MKNRIYLLIIVFLFPCFVIAQGFDDIKLSRSGGSTTASNSSGSVTISDKDLYGGSRSSSNSRSGSNNRDRDRDRGSSNSSHSSSSNSHNSSSFKNDYYERQKSERERKEREKQATILINRMNALVNNECIDIIQMESVLKEFNSLPEDLQNVQGVEGHNARAKLMAQKHNMTPIYNKYSLMAMNIRSLSFGGFNTRILSLSYEDLDKYLKQFLNKHDFERAKVEYKKYEKAKIFEKEIEELYAHWDDKKYLRENSENIQKFKSIIDQQDALKHVNKYHLCLLEIIEKEVEYDEIRQIPLTVSNIMTTLDLKKATKNNADWKEISKGMTSQRLLAVLGTLNSDNDNILPVFVREEGGYYLFVGKPTETETKVATKEYLVSKDGSEIEIYETEGVVANDLVEIKATLGGNKASAKVTSDGEVEKKTGSTVINNAVGAKVTLVNTDWHKQNKKTVYSIDTDGTILQYGAESSVGLKANISGSANANINVPDGETPIVGGNASVGAGIEAAHVGGTLAGKWTPKMIVNPDGSISYKQYSASVEGELSAGVSAKVSASKKGVSAKVGSISAGVSFDSQDIDGALKQIDRDVALGIIKSSIDNGCYKSDFDDETIGKAVVSGIRKEIEDYLKTIKHNSI